MVQFSFTGMLSRWDDSQRFLSDHPYLVCEETAKYLILWCFHLEAEQVFMNLQWLETLLELEGFTFSFFHYLL